MKKIKYLLLSIGVILGIGLFMMPVAANAADIYNCAAYTDPNAADYPLVCKDKDKKVTDFTTPIINIILYAVGSLAVIMIIFSGILYIMSGGDANAVTKAKNTLMYSVIGLIVALLAYAIVNFVLKAFSAA
jgi:hypothetical protein